MNETGLACVLTTIQQPTTCVRRLADILTSLAAPLLVVGDRKGPERFDLPCAEFFSLAEQARLPFRLADLLPTDHYARKNLGYLLAMARGARCIYETDDDTMPGEKWLPRNLMAQAQPVAPRPWVNVYRFFTDEQIWPRGFPLDLIREPATSAHDLHTPVAAYHAPIQQGLTDRSADVDAVWRLVQDRDILFARRPSLWLPPGTWCPFNSQTTWWWPEAYPLLYLPSFCSFRMTDIWRGFVAQRCLWELGRGLVYHGPEAVHERNEHRLLRDFADEVPGYLGNAGIAERLTGVRLQSGTAAVADNLLRCYQELIRGGVLPRKEEPLVRAWVEDLGRLRSADEAEQLATASAAAHERDD